MYARSTTVRGTSQAIDEGIVYVRTAVMPVVQRTHGCIGLSMLAERETGRSIVTTSWADRQSMENSATDAAATQQRAAEIMGGPAEVQEWEIALMHRLHSAHHGACDRVIWHDGDPGDVDRVIDTFRTNVLPELEDLPGCCSVSVLLDRGSGRSAVAVTYDSPQDMRAARERAVQMRTDFMEKMNRTITEVAEFELVISELRVPETA